MFCEWIPTDSCIDLGIVLQPHLNHLSSFVLYSQSNPQSHRPTHSQTHKHKNMAWRNARSRSESAAPSGVRSMPNLNQELASSKALQNSVGAKMEPQINQVAPNNSKTKERQVDWTFVLSMFAISLHSPIPAVQCLQNT